jgi:hypothetical protein
VADQRALDKHQEHSGIFHRILPDLDQDLPPDHREHVVQTAGVLIPETGGDAGQIVHGEAGGPLN